MGDMVSYSKAAVERAMKVEEVILRAMAKKITWWQAAEILGIVESPSFVRMNQHVISLRHFLDAPRRRRHSRQRQLSEESEALQSRTAAASDCRHLVPRT